MNTTIYVKSFLVIVLSIFSAALLADSETCTWTGAVNNNWSENGNWNPHVPGSTDKALIKATVNIVIDQDYTRESPACQALQIGDNDVQTYSVTFSGGHTLFVLGNGGFGGNKNIKSVCKLCSAEITGSGTKVYFDDQVTGRDYYINVSGPLVVSGGAYAEFDRVNFGTVTVQGSDNNGVRSKLKWGKGQNSNMSAATIIADAADIEWFLNSSGVTFNFNTSSVRPSIIARNGGTNDCAVATWGNECNPYVFAENSGVVLLGAFSCNGAGIPEFTCNNGKIKTSSYNPHLSSSGATPKSAKLFFKGTAPQLECAAANTTALTLGKIANSTSVDIDLEPVEAWGSLTTGLITLTGSASYASVSTNCHITVDVSKLNKSMPKGSITFPLIDLPLKSGNGVLPNEDVYMPITVIGDKKENYSVELLPRTPNKFRYGVKITKIKGKSGLCIVFR